MRALIEKEGHARLGGVVFDGRYIQFVRLRNGSVHVEPVRSVSENTLNDLLWWLVGLSGVALTSENLARDFGIDHPRSAETIATLYSALTHTVLTGPDSLVEKLFPAVAAILLRGLRRAETRAPQKVGR